MKWSWKFGEIAGIPLYLHATFLLLLVWVAITHWLRGHGLVAAFVGASFILALFGCVLLHELGHALAARKYGIKTRDITLLPIGGLARLERMPDKPQQELWVALAGPAVNVVIAALLYGVVRFTSGVEPLAEWTIAGSPFLVQLMRVNIFLVLFNMLPAFPMDGGRVLRALLAGRMEFTRATQIAATIGQAMAFLFGLAGLFGNPLLLFIALFVWIGASQEAAMAEIKSAVAEVPVATVMLTDFHVLHARDPLSNGVDLLLRTSQKDFPVINDGCVVGLLTRDRLLQALAESGPERQVSSAMSEQFESLGSSELLTAALERMQISELHTLPVMRNGQLVGLLTLDNLAEFFMVQSALRTVRGVKRPFTRPTVQGDRPKIATATETSKLRVT